MNLGRNNLLEEAYRRLDEDTTRADWYVLAMFMGFLVFLGVWL